MDIRLYDTANTSANETVEAYIKDLLKNNKKLQKRMFGEPHGSGANRHWHIYFW